MKTKVSLPATIVLVLLAALLTFQITYTSMLRTQMPDPSTTAEDTLVTGTLGSALAGTLEGEETGEAGDVLSQASYEKLNYVDALFRTYFVGDIDEEQLVDNLIRGYIVGVGDKYASYMTKDEFTAYMEESSGEMVGIGVHVVYNNVYGALEVVSVMRDSPALEAGVKPGDLIVAVEGETVAQLGYYPAVDKMLGDKGTAANFTVYRGENYTEVKEFSIIRDTVTDTTVEAEMYDANIGIVRITQFAENTGTNVREQVDLLQKKGAKCLIFDVRYNPGGALSGIVDTLDYLLPEGPIIRIVDKQGNVETIDSDESCISMPMIVLVNENTASAAELFSSALQDYKKAIIVGTTTYGKGTMQSVVPLPDGSGITISYRMYNPPFSDNYEGIGVIPDVEIDLDEALKEKNFYTITKEEDNQLQKAIAILNGEE